ncbi:unnamed protein product, partial [Rotaria socialis]
RPFLKTVTFFKLSLFLSMATSTSATPTKAKRKLALVMGIGKYQNIVSLSNPENDADDITSELESITFNT